MQCLNWKEQTLIEKWLLREYIQYKRLLYKLQEIEKATENLITTSVEFDESDSLIIYPTLIGIKVANLKTKEVSFFFEF